MRQWLKDLWFSKYYYVRWLLSGEKDFLVASAIKEEGRIELCNAMMNGMKNKIKKGPRDNE